MRVCTLVCVRVHMHMQVHIFGGQRLTSGVPQIPSATYFVIVSLSLSTWSSPILLRLAGLWVLEICPSPAPQCWGYKHAPPHPALVLHEFWGHNSGPHACKASTLPTQPAPQPGILVSMVSLAVQREGEEKGQGFVFKVF